MINRKYNILLYSEFSCYYLIKIKFEKFIRFSELVTMNDNGQPGNESGKSVRMWQ